MKKLIALTSLLVLSQGNAATQSTKVIYGEDNRVDVIDSTNAMYIELSESTAAMISSSRIRANGQGQVKLGGSQLTDMGICSSERFATQPAIANCSGFLVGEDLLVTAGHCITGQSSCNNNSWVFDYKISQKGQTSITVDQDRVYSCKKIISRELSNWDKNDYALIQLDRKVTGRRVLDIRKSGEISKGENLVVIGHPSGLPTKIADGAYVKSLSGKYFSANLDTYGGNSGSAVFNADTGIIEGILVRGATDYVYDSGQKCRVSNVLGNDSGSGEDVTYITNIAELQ